MEGRIRFMFLRQQVTVNHGVADNFVILSKQELPCLLTYNRRIYYNGNTIMIDPHLGATDRHVEEESKARESCVKLS